MNRIENRIVTIAFGICFALALGLTARGQIQIGSGGGGGGGTPCTTTALSVQYNSSGAFGCSSDFVVDTTNHVITAGALSGSAYSGGFGAQGNSGSNGAPSFGIFTGSGLNTGMATPVGIIVFKAGAGAYAGITSSGIVTYGQVAIGWNSGSGGVDNNQTLDTAFCRNASGVVEVNNGTCGTFRDLIARSHISGGSAPTLSGTCTTGSQTGGNTAGKFTATCTAQTVIMTFALTAPTGWSCNAHDLSTPADALNQTATSTTTATFTGTTVASDTIVFNCMAY